MKNCCQLIWLILLTSPLSVNAQIVPDSTLSTKILPNININGILSDRVDGGASVGKNLFHSFSEFNINAGRGVYFTNPANVTNIFTRVTGANASNINGILGVLGTANLYLMNPNGIVFGVGAKLDLKGSFLGTTANSINFADGSQFSANTNSQPISVLTVSVPIGLGFGSNPKSINVNGAGHNIISTSDSFIPVLTGKAQSSLQVEPEKTLALIGGDINIIGGVLTAQNGYISLGSVNQPGTVEISTNNQNFTFNYSQIKEFGNIQLAQKAIVNANGANISSIQAHGGKISINDGSVLLTQNRGIASGGNIDINASESLELNGTTNDGKYRSSIINETVGPGATGNINISTKRLYIKDGAGIVTRNFRSPNSDGDININATELIQVSGFSPLDPLNAYSSIASLTFFTGQAGSVNASTQELILLNGGVLSSATLGIGTSGNVNVNADRINIIGTTSLISPSNIGSVTFGTGQGGEITVNTGELAIKQGGAIGSSALSNPKTFGTKLGSSGNITINASRQVEVSGSAPGYNSNISTAAATLEPSLRPLLGITPVVIADSGNVTINTPNLKIQDMGSVSVDNYGIGKAGILTINAQNIGLEQKGRISARTILGQGGNIFINAQNLQIRDDSTMSTSAGNIRNPGNGGDITINAETVVQLFNSNITANAFEGNGGNITIDTRGLFSLDSKIRASSQLGVDGEIQIITPDVKQDNSLKQQIGEFISTDKVIASTCIARKNVSQGSFVVTGNGSLPQAPNNSLDLSYVVVPVSPVSITGISSALITKPEWKKGDIIQEATQLVAAENGRLLLVAANSDFNSAQSLICE
jgi:filamentous hemagglutinin family protein